MTWTPEAVAAALGVLAAAIAANAVVLARGYVQVRNILEGVNRAGIPIRGARGAVGGAGTRGGGAISNISNAVGTLNIPPEAQRQDVTVVPRPAWTGSVDCGPECVVATLQYEHGQESAAQLLRLRYFGVIDMRLTNADDLVGMLRQNGVEAHPRYVSADVAVTEMDRNLQLGRPSLVLMRYVGGSTLHWYVVSGHPGNTWVLMDPWIGANMTVPNATLLERYQGQYVHVDSLPPASSG